MADIICSCDHHHHHHHQPRRIRRRRRRSRIMDDNDDVRNKFKFVPDNDHVAAESSSSSSSSLPSSKRQKMMMMEDMIITSSTTPTPMLLSDSNETELSSSNLSGGNNNLADSAQAVVVVVEINNVVDKFRCPKFSFTSVCGRRRAMEDAVAIHPSFCCCCCEDHHHHQDAQRFHFFGVYDGHGCSHVAMNCKDRLHELVKEEVELELEKKKMKMKMKMMMKMMINNNNRDRDREEEEEEEEYWKEVMERSFDRMDKEVLLQQNNNNNITTAAATQSSCKCELQMPQCDAVGSTAVVSIVTSDKVVVANCGDSRAILCRDGKAVPLSVDHKPDLPEELNRIEEAGGRVIYWDGPRVLGVLAMSRAIGDNYLKPYVSSVPEITVTERSEEDEFLIMASDGLWDVVSNDTACDFVRMCLDTTAESPIFIKQHEKTSSAPAKDGGGIMFGEDMMDKGCSDAAMLLTKLAMARRSDDNVSVVVVDLRRTRTDGRCNVEEQRKKEENTETEM